MKTILGVNFFPPEILENYINLYIDSIYCFVDNHNPRIKTALNVTVLSNRQHPGHLNKLLNILAHENDPDISIIMVNRVEDCNEHVLRALRTGIQHYPHSCVGYAGWKAGTSVWTLEPVVQQNAQVDWLVSNYPVAYKKIFFDQRLKIFAHLDSNHHDHAISAYLEQKNISRRVINISHNASKTINLQYLPVLSVSTHLRNMKIYGQLPVNWWNCLPILIAIILLLIVHCGAFFLLDKKAIGTVLLMAIVLFVIRFYNLILSF